MEETVISTELQGDLEKLYKARFSGSEDYRNQVWKILVADFFSKWISPDAAVLDVGCGYGEFLRHVNAARKFGIDLNPTARQFLPENARLLQQDCSAQWPLAGNSLDVVFSSNFFEHLPDKAALQRTLSEAYRCLRPGGRLIAMGPNIKYLHGSYWDFFDHLLPLTELALSEALLHVGFQIERAIPKFLPYTMSLHARRPPTVLVKAYLRVPLLWKLMGRQFLVIAAK